MLERVVFDQNVIGATDRDALFKPSGLSALEVADRVVEAYRSQAPTLAYGLYEQISDTDWRTAELLFGYFGASGPAYYNHQASLVGRIPTLPLDELNDFLTSVKGQVCLIVSRNGAGKVVRGTGFLVGPDLVLTCRHVLKHVPDHADITHPNNRIEIYFDFHHGEPVDCLDPDLPHARRVDLAEDWCVASCDATDPDGVLGELTPRETERIRNSLDFVLLRLAQKVGLQTIERGGGRQRRWVDVSAASVPKAVHDEDWIIIPQHPSGLPQRIDLGRFRTFDATNTRLRYDTNTAPGSSGAPCFNHKFLLVGLHNASVGSVANQAIRATCIAPLVQGHIAASTSAPRYIPRWSVARDAEPPLVILGREKLLWWLHASASVKADKLADRVYAAQAEVHGAGCSFSIDMLHAEIRDSKTPRAVYGQRGQQLPSTAEDFLLSILRELGIAEEEGKSVPKRPKPPSSESSAIDIGEVDKLERWISQELPDWLGNTINRHVEREIDAREPARNAVEQLNANGIEIPETLRITANSADPVYVRPNAWNYAYIAIDDLRSSSYSGPSSRTDLKGEVRSLIAALVRGKGQATIHPGLRRLRWMFLGYVPDFIPVAGLDGGATLEILDPASVGMNEILSIYDRMSQAHLQMREDSMVARRVLARGVLRSAESCGAGARLASLQVEASITAADFLREMEG